MLSFIEQTSRSSTSLLKHGFTARPPFRKYLHARASCRCWKKLSPESCVSRLALPNLFSPASSSSMTCCFPRRLSSRSSDTKFVHLMNMTELIWPNPAMSLSNWVKGKLISGYYDITFNTKEFLSGAQQAVETVSSLISRGRFEELSGLVDDKVIPELRKNYDGLNDEQRKFISVSSADIYYPFVYEIGMMFDDQSEKRYVEIMTVFQGIHGSGELRQRSLSDITAQLESDPSRMFVCNYRFFREFTKGIKDEWTINALNHFSPQELVKRFPYGK